MAKTIISEGKTTAEAIEKGLKAIGLPKELVEIKVIDDNKKSFFDILAPKVVKVELKEKEAKKPEEFEIETTEDELNNAKTKIEEFLKEFTEKLANGTTYEIEIKEKLSYEITLDNGIVEVEMQGKNAGFLIGYRGETLYALRTLITSIANKGVESRVILRLDIENYKEKREKTLENLALRTAQTVMRTGKTITLEPMQAYERKIIHSFLQENPKVETRSIGQEPRRRIVISKK